jgi:hypothetical protein
MGKWVNGPAIEELIPYPSSVVSRLSSIIPYFKQDISINNPYFSISRNLATRRAKEAQRLAHYWGGGQ